MFPGSLALQGGGGGTSGIGDTAFGGDAKGGLNLSMIGAGFGSRGSGFSSAQADDFSGAGAAKTGDGRGTLGGINPVYLIAGAVVLFLLMRKG